jgi:hypothetical protein
MGVENDIQRRDIDSNPGRQNKTDLLGLLRLDTDIPALLKPGAIRVLDGVLRNWVFPRPAPHKLAPYTDE